MIAIKHMAPYKRITALFCRLPESGSSARLEIGVRNTAPNSFKQAAALVSTLPAIVGCDPCQVRRSRTWLFIPCKSFSPLQRLCTPINGMINQGTNQPARYAPYWFIIPFIAVQSRCNGLKINKTVYL